jgi:hypothetical protein
VGPRAVLDAVVMRKIPSSPPSIVQPAAQRYTDWAITAFRLLTKVKGQGRGNEGREKEMERNERKVKMCTTRQHCALCQKFFIYTPKINFRLMIWAIYHVG